MKDLVLFGGTGGIGKQLTPLLEKKYNVLSVGSIVDVSDELTIQGFINRTNPDIVINLSGKKYDVFLNEVNFYDLMMINEMIDVNIKGNINILTSCLPKMIEKGWGRIIGISSIFSQINVPKNGIYAASKAFMERLYSTANRENAKFGVTCNTIQLGFWDGGMCYRVDEHIQEKAKQKIPLKRWGTIEELYNTIDFIIENEYISGTNLKMDGGLY